MARKNVRADNSIQFDIRTNTVMAQSTTSHNHVKQKVSAVREVVPGKSFDEIVLVLQYYDYNSEKAIQAYLEDDAKEALQQWHFSGSKVQNKKKKPKKGKAEEGGNNSPDINGTATPNSNNNNPLVENHMLNGNHAKDISDQSSVPASIKQDVPHPVNSQQTLTSNSSLDRRDEVQLKPNKSSVTNHREKQQNHSSSRKQHSGNKSAAAHDAISTSRARTVSECSVSSFTAQDNFAHKKGGLERTVKDLQRQTASLERLRLTFDGEIDRCPKKIKSVFEDVRTALSNREIQMIIEFEQMKLHSRELFTMRQNKAHELKVRVDRADSMNEQELAELRADVKHFVSERKLDEDLAKATRFMYDSDFIISEIKKFGEIVQTRHSYSDRRPSTSSIASSGPGHNHHHPVTTNHSNHPPTTTTTDTATKTDNGTNNSKDDDSDVELTAQDLEDLQKRLQNSMRINKGPPRNRPRNVEHGSNDRRNNNTQRRNDRSPRKYDDRPRENRQRSPRKADERPQSSRDPDDKPKNNQQQQSNAPRREGSGRGRGRGGYRGRGRGRGNGRSPGKDASTNGNKSENSTAAPVANSNTNEN